MSIKLTGIETDDSVPLAQSAERAKLEFQSSFYDLAGFVMKEFKNCIAAMKHANGFDQLPDDTLRFMSESFSRRCERYIAAKKAFREHKGTIVSPDVGLS